jgi:RNA polymerase sigma factor for flagellar operon FliA
MERRVNLAEGMQLDAMCSRARLIEQNAVAARRIALSVARRCPGWIAREDLVGAAMIGLCEAADRYDRSREEPFMSFAERRIRGAVLDELRRGDIMPRRKRQLARRVRTIIAELEQAGEPASDERIAEKLGVSVDEYRADIAPAAQVEVAPLDCAAPHLTIEDQDAPDVEACRRVTLERIRAGLPLLDPRDAAIIGMHFLGDLSYPEIAAELGVTPSRVCQLMARAVARLRTLLGMRCAEA